MRILSLFFKDHINNIEVSELEFDQITMLAGTSGAGKTTIIRALHHVLAISRGENSPGDEWRVVLKDGAGRLIVWSGIFAQHNDDSSKMPVKRESVVIDGDEVLNRDSDSLQFNNAKLPKLDKYVSALYLLRDNDEFQEIVLGLKGCSIIENQNELFTNAQTSPVISSGILGNWRLIFSDTNEKSKNDAFKEQLRAMNVREKLYVIKTYFPEKFQRLLHAYQDIFTVVEDIDVGLLNERSKDGDSLSAKVGVVIELKLVDGRKVVQQAISSGMFKTLMLLTELQLSSADTIVVIDELENSLGVNCLPEVVNELLSSGVQAIVSTHHPKVINNIATQYWRIVARNKEKIVTLRAEELLSSASKHEKFIQLLNSDIYQSGVIE